MLLSQLCLQNILQGAIFKDNRYCCRNCVSRISYRGSIFKISLGDMHCKRVWNWILLPQDWGASVELQPSPELLGNSEFLAGVNDCKLFKDTLARSIVELSFPWRCGYMFYSVMTSWIFQGDFQIMKGHVVSVFTVQDAWCIFLFCTWRWRQFFFQNVDKHYQLTQHHKPKDHYTNS
jgi:hypothetical protein